MAFASLGSSGPGIYWHLFAGDRLPRLSGLKTVAFEHAAPKSSLLSRHGIVHGFQGVGADRVSAHHVRQVHGTTIVDAPMDPPKAESFAEADGLATTAPGSRIAVKTADCLPVLAVDLGRQ